jgi:mono/diheme cytochrome c family protein
MWRGLVNAAIVLSVAALAAFWLFTEPRLGTARTLGPHQPDPANGKTLFHAGDCVSCHAVPGQDDKTRLGGGRALNTAFGTFHAPNISPDPADGIGAWSEADFVAAMAEGVSPDRRHYYPAFPYTSFARITTDDLRDLFAYLKTLPAVAGKVRDHELSFPFNIRRGIGLWKLLYLDNRPFAPDPQKSAQLNRGAYLVEGAGHCAECHSPRDALGGIIASQRFAGGPNPEGKGWVPNITAQRLKDWSDKDIAYLLETGQTPDGDSVGSQMAEVVRNTELISAEDRAAIAAYVKSLPPVEGPKPPAKPSS